MIDMVSMADTVILMVIVIRHDDNINISNSVIVIVVDNIIAVNEI